MLGAFHWNTGMLYLMSTMFIEATTSLRNVTNKNLDSGVRWPVILLCLSVLVF